MDLEMLRNITVKMSLGRDSQKFFEQKGVNVVTTVMAFSSLSRAIHTLLVPLFPCLNLEYEYIRTIRERMTSKPVSSSSSTEVQGQSHPAPAR
jgi:hypothetical protein